MSVKANGGAEAPAAVRPHSTPTSHRCPLTYARDEGDAAGVVGRGLAEAAGERPADVSDVAVVAGGRAARAGGGRVSPRRAAVVRVGDRDAQPRRPEAARDRADFEVHVVVNLQDGGRVGVG